MDDRNPGRLYRESGSSMEVAYDCSDAREVVHIESQGGREPLCWNGGMGLGTKREAPKLGTGGFLTSTEDDSGILGKDSDIFIFGDDAEVVVTQFSDAHKVVMEVRYYVTAHDGELQEDQVA